MPEKKSNSTSMLMRRVSKASHGTTRQITAPSGSRLRENSTVVDIGFAFDTALFAYLREKKTVVPMINTFFSSGFEGAPRFATLQPDVSPALVSAVYTQALSAIWATPTLELSGLIAQLATTHGLSDEASSNIVIAAQEFSQKLHTRGLTELVSSYILQASNGRTGAALVGAYAESPRPTWSTLRLVYQTLADLYGSLGANESLSIMNTKLTALLQDPTYKQLYQTYVGLRTLPLSMTSVSLYLLAELHNELEAPSDARPKLDQILPWITNINPSLDGIDPIAHDLFGIPRQVSTDAGTVAQMKFWGVSNPLTSTLDVNGFIQAVGEFDSAIFGMPRFQVDLQTAFEVVLSKKGSFGLPQFPESSPNYWDHPTIQTLVGYSCLETLTNNTGNTLSSTLTGLLSQIKTDKDTLTFIPIITAHIKTMVAIFNAFAGVRNMMWDVCQNMDRFSTIVPDNGRDTEATPFRLGSTRLQHHGTLKRYVELYANALERAAEVPLIQGVPAALFHISNVQTVPAPFRIGTDDFESTLIVAPNYHSTGGSLTMRIPFHQMTEGKAQFVTTSMRPIEAAETSRDSSGTYSRLAIGTGLHTVVHARQETFPSGSLELQQLVRHFPTEMQTFFASAGRAEAVLKPSNKGTLPATYVIAELVTRMTRGFKTTLGMESLRAAFLNFIRPDGFQDVVVDTGDLSMAIKRQYASVTVNGLFEVGDKQFSLAALEGVGSYLDLGSSDIVFIFEAQNQLSVEDAASMTEPSHLPAPLFAVHISDTLPGYDVNDLLAPVTADSTGQDLEIHGSVTIVSEPEVKTKFGEDKDPTSEELTTVNDVTVVADEPNAE